MMRPRTFTAVVLAATMVLALAALVTGPGTVGWGGALEVIAAHLFDGAPPATEDAAIVDALVWGIRVPRVLLAIVVGWALAAAGTVTQGLFRNPMAEPGVLGISSGAAAAAVLGFTLGLDTMGLWVTPMLAGVGALVVLAILMLLARPVGGMTTLLLSGIALGALFSALGTLMLALGADRWDLGLKVVRWMMGSFEGRGFTHLGAAVVATGAGYLSCTWLRVDLDVLQLGEETGVSLGVDLRRTQAVAMLAIALLVGTATALCGVIGFVGLVAPHLARAWVGAGHRALLPAATALGGFIVLAVDTAARTVPVLALPPGAITALLGAPFFLWILRRHDPEGMR